MAVSPHIPADFAQHQARLARIKREIELGIYETPEKMEAAIEAFLDSPDAESAGDGPNRS